MLAVMMKNAAFAATAVVIAFSLRGGVPDTFSVASAFVPNLSTSSASRTRFDSRTNCCEVRTLHAGQVGPCDSLWGRRLGVALSMSTTAPPAEKVEVGSSSDDSDLPEPGEDGIHHLTTKEQHIAFLAANKDKLVALKFFAPWCRACKGLEPKFIKIANDPKYAEIPIVFADLTVQHNKDYIKSLGVLALPSMHLHAGADGGLVENFPCGPSKVPILKKKLVQLVNDWVDPQTMTLKKLAPAEVDSTTEEMKESEPCKERLITATGPSTQVQVGDVTVSDETMNYLRKDIPYFKDLSDDEFSTLMKKAKVLTFEPGSIIMREGMPGRLFYVIMSGEVEISVKTAFEDPLTTPSNYLGATINRLKKNNYFGERSLITGEPRAASIRAAEKTRCFAFDVDDIPSSSVLSGKASATTERLAEVNDKYGVDVYDIDFIKDQFQTANVANQNRGSVNRPDPIKGVDTSEDVEDDDMQEVVPGVERKTGSDEFIIPLLIRFKLIRHAAQCFEYVMHTQPRWGDAGEKKRRSMLVSKLTRAQRDEFTDVFKIIDESGDGLISLLELKRFMESIGEEKSDSDLEEMINKSDITVEGNKEISFEEFLGVMAEAEFYNLFKETFMALDKHNSGFVRAKDLDRVLCGVRDLISDDRMSIIDVEDKEMMIDYEQFSKMLLGTNLGVTTM